MKHYNLLLILLLFVSCDVSTLSSKDLKGLNKLKINITIEDVLGNTTLSQIKVRLSDGKKQVINKDISILLNGSPLKLYVKNELYYTKTSFYETDNLLRKDDYYFEIILPNKTKYPIGYIKPVNKDSDLNFTIPENAFLNEDYTLKWKNLSKPYTIEVLKGVENLENKKDNYTSYAYKNRLIDSLKTETGEYVIPKSYFLDTLTIARHLSISLSTEESGLINPNLKPNSTITLNRYFEKTVNFNPQH